MRVYTVHLRRHGLDAERDLVLVKEGFSWPAFVAGVLWALWHRLWLFALLLALAAGTINGIVYLTGADSFAGGVLSFALAVGAGWIGNDMRRRVLEKKGFAFVGVVTARNDDDAARRFLDNDPIVARQIGMVGTS